MYPKYSEPHWCKFKTIVHKFDCKQSPFFGVKIVLNMEIGFFFVKLIEVKLINVNKVRISQDFLRIEGKTCEVKGGDFMNIFE